MATLLDIITAFEARQVAAPPPAALTPRGEVVATITRLADLLSTLDDADRAYVAPMLEELASLECVA